MFTPAGVVGVAVVAVVVEVQYNSYSPDHMKYYLE
jgi:hypothetical protein